VDLLNCEFDCELRATEERLREWSHERLQDEGFALFGLIPRREQDLQNTVVFRFQAPPPRSQHRRPSSSTTHGHPGGIVAAARARREQQQADGSLLLPELPYNRFMAGDMCAATLGKEPPGGDSAGVSVTGIVLERGPAWIKVAVSEGSAQDVMSSESSGTTWRLDLAANAVAHERMVLAMSRFSQPGGMPVVQIRTEESAVSFTPLQRALLGGDDAAECASLPPPWLASGRSGRRAALACADAMCGGLNDSQRNAVATALQRTLTQWQGPPGTGKTRTLLAFIRAAVAMLAETRTADGPLGVLACAPSNVAADAIVEGLVLRHKGRGGALLRVVRLGSPAKVAEHVRECTLYAAAQGHPAMQKSQQLRASASAAGSGSEAAALRRMAREEEAVALSATLRAADVVVSTCSGAGDEGLMSEVTFSIVVIDEATQATEPAAMVPLVRAAAALLVGDAQQLPPTVVSADALSGGLATSLPERLQRVAVPMLLDTQYRMHPGLAAFPSLHFYAGRLRSAPTPSDRLQPAGFPWPVPGASGLPLAFVDVPHGEERRVGVSDSVCNVAEAATVAHIVRLLLAGKDVEPHQVGVVTPYAAQVALITRALGQPAVSVRSVDGFQGQEREVIVFSCVRANSSRQLGFTADARRVNVAITRAKRGLVVCGNRETLRGDATWAAWLAHVDVARAQLDLPRVPIDDALARAVKDVDALLED